MWYDAVFMTFAPNSSHGHNIRRKFKRVTGKVLGDGKTELWLPGDQGGFRSGFAIKPGFSSDDQEACYSGIRTFRMKAI